MSNTKRDPTFSIELSALYEPVWVFPTRIAYSNFYRRCPKLGVLSPTVITSDNTLMSEVLVVLRAENLPEDRGLAS